MNLVDMKILREDIDAQIKEEKKTSEECKISNITPNTSIDDNSQVPNIDNNSNNFEKKENPNVILSKTDLEKLEDKINNSYTDLDISIVESFYHVNEILIDSINLLETISIDAIHKQYNILCECALDSDDYNDKIESLIESTGNTIIQTIIDAIKKFVLWVKRIASEIGINVSMNLVNYEKWVNSKKDILIKKADKYGSRVEVNVRNWDSGFIYSLINLKAMQAEADKIVPNTSSKSEMEKIESDIAEKYENSKEMILDVYTHALSAGINGSPDSRKFTDQKMALSAVKAKMVSDSKTRYMDSDYTKKCIDILSTIKSDTSKCLAHIRASLLDPNFEQLLKNLDNAMKERADKENSTKYKYYRLRYEALTSAQNAANDLYRLKCTAMREYSNEIYNSLKKLDSFKDKENTNESVDMNPTLINNAVTLHA